MLVKKIYPLNGHDNTSRKSVGFADFLEDKLIISTHSFLYILKIKEIIYIEAAGNYSKIHMSDGRIISASKTLKHIESSIKNHLFFRVHAGFLVNMEKLVGIKKNGSYTMIFDQDKEVPISNKYRSDILSKFQMNKV